jgi:hypothetical protein
MPTRREGRKPARRPPAKPSPVAGLLRAHWPMAVAVLLVGSGGVLGLALVFPGGSIATPLNVIQGHLLGWTAALLALWLTAVGVVLLSHHLRPDTHLPWRRAVGALLASVALVALAGLASYVDPEPEAVAAAGHGGGLVGLALARALAEALGSVGSGVLLALLALVGVVVALDIPPARLVAAAEALAFATGHLSRTIARRLRRPAALPPVLAEPGSASAWPRGCATSAAPSARRRSRRWSTKPPTPRRRGRG